MATVAEEIKNEELLKEIRENKEYGLKVLGFGENVDRISLIVLIYEFLNDKKKVKKAAKRFGDDNDGIAIALGMLWGHIVCEQYGWNWRDVVTDGDYDHCRTSVVSPGERYYVDVVNLFVWICRKGNENTTLDLFYKMDGIEEKYPPSDNLIMLQ